MGIVIKEAKIVDALTISELAKEMFPLACPIESDVNEIKAYSEKNLSVDFFQTAINAKNSSVICAWVEEELAGFVVLIFDSICPDTPALEKPVELQKFYVKTIFHRTKVTRSLMNEAKSVCLKRKYSDIWLGVYSSNERAKKFYSKFEFVLVGTTNFIMGSEIHLDNIMIAKIS